MSSWACGEGVRRGASPETAIEIASYASRYGSFLDEVEADLQEFARTGVMHRALELSRATRQHFNHNQCPLYFTGDLDADLVLVHLNPKQANDPSPRYSGEAVPTFEEYFDWARHFGERMYGQASARSHRSPFDQKQIRFLRPFNVIDFVEESSRSDRFTNLERAIDGKLQLELIPYGSDTFASRGLTPQLLSPHWNRILRVVSALERRYVLFCGAVFEPLLRDLDAIADEHSFRLVKRDGTRERARSRYANLRIPFEGRLIKAGLAHSWARQGIPMGSYAEEILIRYAR